MQEKLNESDFVERLGKPETRDEAFRQFFKIYSKRLSKKFWQPFLFMS